jgi:hypothetical protein
MATQNLVSTTGQVVNITPPEGNKPTKFDVKDMNGFLTEELATWDDALGSQPKVGEIWQFDFTVVQNGKYTNRTIKFAHKVEGNQQPPAAPVAQPVAKPTGNPLLEDFGLADKPTLDKSVMNARDKSIVRQVAFKGAIEVLALSDTLRGMGREDIVQELALTTDDCEAILYGELEIAASDEGDEFIGHASRESAAQFYDQN